MVLEIESVIQETLVLEFVLDNLDLADQIDVTGPARHLFVDLLVLVHNFHLLFEKLFVDGSIYLVHVAAVVELFVVDENVGF